MPEAPHYTPGQEAGEQDNLLTLDTNDPRWKETIANWEDGGEYTITKGVIRQIEPGQYTLVSATFGGPPEEEAPTTEAETEGETGMGGMMGGAKRNPALAEVLSQEE